MEVENEQNHNAGLSGQLEDVKLMENESQAGMDQVGNLAAEVTVMVKHFEAELKNLESLICCVQTREIELDTELKAKQKEVEQVTSKKDELEKRFMELAEKLEIERSRVTNLYTALEERGKEIVEAATCNVRLVDASAKMEIDLRDAQRDIANLNENSENMKSELRRAEAQVRDTLEEKDNLKLVFEQKGKQLEEERSTLSGRLELNETLNAELKDRCSQLEVLLGRQETTFRKFQQELGEYLKQISTELEKLNDVLQQNIAVVAPDEDTCERQEDESMFLSACSILFFFAIMSIAIWIYP